MRSNASRWLWAHFLTLLVLSASGAVMALPGTAHSQSPVYDPDSGGGGTAGDPDTPQKPPEGVVGPGPDYNVSNPDDGGAAYGGQFGGYRVLGRNSGSLWTWRLRFLIAGLRSYYLRF